MEGIPEEKPDQHPDQSRQSLFLGILAVLTCNPLLIYPLLNINFMEPALEVFFGGGWVITLAISLISGLAGVIKGNSALKQKKGRTDIALAGVFLCGVAIFLDITCAFFTTIPGWGMF